MPFCVKANTENFDLLLNDINDKNNLGYTVYICSDNQKQLERLHNIFLNLNERDGIKVSKFKELNLSVHSGFIDNVSKICLYTDHQIFDKYHRVKIKREVQRSERLTLNELSAFNIGDYVVHENHGLGIYRGIEKVEVEKKLKDYIKIEYAGSGNL